MTIKQQLYQYCQMHLATQMEIVNKALHDASEAVMSDTKSSAGDKHETSRAMAQLEQEYLNKQKAEILSQCDVFSKIQSEITHQSVVQGALVSTNLGKFYIAINAGKIILNDDTCFCISVVSPIAQAMLHAKTGESRVFNGKPLTIHHVE